MDMNETELRDEAIRDYVNLQRLKTAADINKEIEYQERVLKARLQAMGITTENLDIN